MASLDFRLLFLLLALLITGSCILLFTEDLSVILHGPDFCIRKREGIVIGINLIRYVIVTSLLASLIHQGLYEIV